MAQAKATSRSFSAQPNDVTIGAGTQIRGRITGDSGLTLDGLIEGELSLQGNFVVTSTGSATANVEAREVTVAGRVEGDITASGPVRLLAGSKVRGTVRGAEIALEEGASFTGRLDCDFELPSELTRRS